MSGSPRKIILDTDPGVDDVLAILLALASPEVDVRLISIVFGNTHAPVAHSNLLKIYHLLASELVAIPESAIRYGRLEGQEGAVGKTVVAVGEDGPIGGEKAVAAYFVSDRFAVPRVMLRVRRSKINAGVGLSILTRPP
jgi:hypothetical protein